MYSDLLFEYFQIFESPTKDTVYILFIILLLKYLLYFIIILQDEGLNREGKFSFFG